MILIAMAVAIGTAVQAQTLESSSDFPTGYLVTNYYDRSNTIQSIDGVLYLISDDIPIVLVKYPPMNPREEFEVIENNEETVSHISKNTTEDRTEEGRYDLSGRKVEAADDGVQIVVYNDKTAKKVLK